MKLISMCASMLNHRMLLIQIDLLGIVIGASNPMDQVALVMGAFTTESRESRRISQDNQTSEKKPKGPAEIWKYMLPTLLNI